MDCLPLRGLLPGNGKESLQLESKMAWEHSTKMELQLQWRLGWGCCNPHAEQKAWDLALSCPLPGLPAKTLGATDQFFHTCISEADAIPGDAISKLSDAAIIVREGEINWPYLDELTGAFQQIEPVRETILQLGQLKMGIPDAIVARWRERKASPLEDLEKACRARPVIRRWRIKHSALNYLRLNQGASLGVLCRDIGAYLQQLDDLKGILRRCAVIFYIVCWNRLRKTSVA
jgi:hypothetical protein